MANAVESKLNLMAGTVRSLDQEVGTQEDKAIFDRDFDLLVRDLKTLADPELGQDLANEKDFYASVFQVAKGYFNKKPFGGLKATTGQFGMRLITPQDLRTAAGTETPAYYSWHQTVTTDSGDTDTKGLAYSSSYAYTQNLANKNEVMGFHRLLSYTPAPRILYLEFYVNGVGYMPYSVEPFSKIGKPDKLFKILPMPGRILLHPGGHFYCVFWLDLFGGTTAPSGTASIEVEIAPFGITFAEYDFLASANIV